MATGKGSPSRRKSIAVVNQNQPAHPGRRRRAHSIAPGQSLSPTSKARRSLAPRKSILKASLNFADEPEATESFLSINDSRTEIHDKYSRKSLGRRVSFAEHAHVRLFETQEQNTNSTASPQSSPAAEADKANPPVRATNDENAYPGARVFQRRASIRSSIAFSEGGERSMDMDMDDTAPGPSAFFDRVGESAIVDEFDDYDIDGEEDMEITTFIPQKISRSRPPSLGPSSRIPLGHISSEPPFSTNDDSQELEGDQSFTEEMSIESHSANSAQDDTQPMEFTVPLIRPPAPPNDAWLALRSVTHSGSTPYVPPDPEEGSEDGMELTDALSRLMAVRASLSLDAGETEENAPSQENSFASTEDSFEDQSRDADGDQTVNMTQLRRMSEAHETDDGHTTDMQMDDVTGEILSGGLANPASQISPSPLHDPPTSNTLQSTGPDEPVQQQTSSRLSVFTDATPQSSKQIESVPRSNIPRLSIIPNSPTVFTPPLQPRKSLLNPQPPDSSAVFIPPLQPRKSLLNPQPPDSSAVFTPPTSSSQTERPISNVDAESTGSRPTTERSRVGPIRRFSSLPRRSEVSAQSLKTTAPPSPSKKDRSQVPPSSISHLPSEKNTVEVRQGMREEEHRVAGESSLRQSPRPGTSISHAARPPPNTVAHAGLGEGMEGSGSRQETMNATEHWRDGIQQEDSEEPTISIQQFLELTGIRFMDEITAPPRSAIRPSMFRPARHSSANFEIPLVDYVIGLVVNVPQLELYTHVSKDLEAWIERIKELYEEAEEEAAKITPELFREFMAAEQEGRTALLHQLKLIKVNSHGQAKSEWYDWKLQWVGQLYQEAERGFKALESDAKVLEGVTRQAREVLPQLRDEYQQIMRELEQEQKLVEEIENSDQDYLTELKATLAEQSAELEAFRVDVDESNAKLQRLQEKSDEINSQKQETTFEIASLQRFIHVQKSSTRFEVYRLKDELEAMQDLHKWRITKVHSDLLEVIYTSTYRISIPCAKHRPLLEAVKIEPVESSMTSTKQSFPALNALMLRTAQQLVSTLGDCNVRKIVEFLGDYWSSCSQVLLQLKLMALKYPVSVQIAPSEPSNDAGFTAIVSVMIPKVKAKALISFTLDTKIISSWPMSIGSVQCDVTVAYGPIQRDPILKAVLDRLGQASPGNNHACLLEACTEAMDKIS